ncbi:MAG: energy-coupling factor transporter ATPase [Clostridia bacterium]|nr:energy-coupling factor transporter ATPase [Clostridia bacterium]
MSEILRLENVSYIYSRRTPYEKKALDGIDLSFEKGSVTGIIGHTGSGKSTLVRLLNGLERPTEGRVFFNGEDIWKKPREIGRLRFRIGLVMQYPEYQLFEETVGRDIAYGPKNMKLPQAEIDRRVAESAATVGLSEDVLEMPPFDLSGGRKRRAAIAGVMAMEPEVLILDEPAAGLDPEGRNRVFDAVERYRVEKNATVIIVSHSMEEMAARCDRLVILCGGRIAASGMASDIFGDPGKLISAGLELPQVGTLAMLLEGNGLPLGRPVTTVGEAADAIAALLDAHGFPPRATGKEGSA